MITLNITEKKPHELKFLKFVELHTKAKYSY